MRVTDKNQMARKGLYVSVFALLFATALFLLVITVSGDLFAKNEKAKGHEIEGLFRDMALIKPTHIKGPVEFRLTDLTGVKRSISDFRGKIIFLNFWTTWCPPCRQEMPSMERLHKRFKDKDFVMLAVNMQETASQVRAFFKRYDLTFRALLDSKGEVGTRFGIRSIPTTFILDREGRLIGVAIGPREWDSRQSVALFEYLIEKGPHASS